MCQINIIMEIYKLRLSYAVYQKKKWNLMKLLLKTSHFNGHSILHHQKESKNSEKNSDGRRQVHLPRCLRVEKERRKHNSNLTIRMMIKKTLFFFFEMPHELLLEQTWIIWVIWHDELNFRLPCVWQNTLAFKNFCSNYLILLYGFRMHFLRAQSIAF